MSGQGCVRSRWRRVAGTNDDAGVVLLLALLTITVLGLLTAALVTQAQTSLGNTRNLSTVASRLAAAQSGMDNAFGILRSDDTLCAEAPASAGTQTGVSSLTVNGYSVTTSCETLSGTSAGAAGYTALVMSTSNDAIQTSNGGSKTVYGSVYDAGQISNAALKKPLTIVNGNFVQPSGSCQSTAALSGFGLTVTPSPPYAASCLSAATLAVLAPPIEASPGTAVLTGALSVPATDGSVCRVFQPGTYSSPPVLDTSGTIYNYFTSGPYLFNFNGNYANAAWTLKQTVVIGGSPSSYDDPPVQFARPGCADVAEVGSTYGSGVTFRFAGQSHINFDSGGHLELFTREPTPGVFRPSIIAIRAGNSAQPGESALGVTDELISPQNGSTPDISVHGLYFAPVAFLPLVATSDVHTSFTAGIVTGKLSIDTPTSASGLLLSNKRAPGSRIIKVISVATATGGGRTVTATAIVKIQNADTSRTVGVLSWRSD